MWKRGQHKQNGHPTRSGPQKDEQINVTNCHPGIGLKYKIEPKKGLESVTAAGQAPRLMLGVLFMYLHVAVKTEAKIAVLYLNWAPFKIKKVNKIVTEHNAFTTLKLK